MSKPVLDVLCVGHACYDLVFSVPRHPQADEKLFANSLLACGGGPAANAAVTVSKLGYQAGFAGYLGHDVYGQQHLQEFHAHQVNTDCVVRGAMPTPLSVVLVKPNGERALVNYKADTQPLAKDSIRLPNPAPKTVLFDGHEPHVSVALCEKARQAGIPTVLDAGSVHEGTLALMENVDYLVCSEKFAKHWANDEHAALQWLAARCKLVVITLSERGLLWRQGNEHGMFPAFAVEAIDSTGAGDAFHGAFAAAVAAHLPWQELLRYASAAGALCCTKMGARTGIPDAEMHQALLRQ